jgi:hypothetical protein
VDEQAARVLDPRRGASRWQRAHANGQRVAAGKEPRQLAQASTKRAKTRPGGCRSAASQGSA